MVARSGSSKADILAIVDACLPDDCWIRRSHCWYFPGHGPLAQWSVLSQMSLVRCLPACIPWNLVPNCLLTCLSAMGNPTPETIGLITALVFVGGFAGALVVAYPADQFGRRPTIQFGSLVCVIGSALQSAAPNKNVFIGGRFILGFGISFTTCAAPSLLNELSHPRLRGKIASMVRTTIRRN